MGPRIAYVVMWLALLVAVVVVFFVDNKVQQNETSLLAHEGALQRQHDILENSIIAQCRVLDSTVQLHREQAQRDEELLALAIRIYTAENSMVHRLAIHVNPIPPTMLRSMANADALYAKQITRISRTLNCTPVNSL